MTEFTRYSDLNKSTRSTLDRYIEGEFGAVPIVQNTEWAIPDWTVILYEEGEIAAFYNIVIRNILIDGTECKAGGINNLITPQSFRGNGYATQLMQDAGRLLFDELSCELGILLCADELIPFYERFGWYAVGCPVYFDQPAGKQRWDANTMLLTVDGKREPREIDLNGLPW